jgi:two-component system chemotaxis response regulator CheY
MARILIADDSMFMRAAMRDILEKAGHRVVGEAATGLAAVELYAELTPDIVTMDITMPLLGGIEALKKIRAINKNAAVIMVTSISKPESAGEALNCGAKSYITKPFDAEKVLKAIG